MATVSLAMKVKYLYCNRNSLFGNFTVLASGSGFAIQPYQDPLALWDCPVNTIQSFVSIFGDMAVMVGDVVGFKCQKLPTGNT